ncbi:hypothetical protein [Lentzea flava]|uniref:Uncharacterized protein n=1 Tax=Lentzea flava TaxID=103732 RepID=A0ABQ2V9V9_9PSEU|nr:hypothetical protein [Lentzea flava]MCP2203879.1 hypothetical protein [Lentzea flava]GGU72459.1 hypothetical protein GCM10010178_75120 [Lentzea flava]
MPAHRPSHVPSGRPLWSLLEDAVVDNGVDGEALTVRGRWGDIVVADPNPVVREALRRMTLGPVALENIWPLNENFARWKAGSGPCTEWRRLKRTLDQLGGVVVPSLGHLDGAGPILSVIAVAHDAVFTLPHVDDDQPVRLRPEAVIEGLNGDQVLVVPGLRYQVVLHREPATAVAKALLAGDTTITEISGSLQLDRPVVADVVAYLTGAGFTLPGRSLPPNADE